LAAITASYDLQPLGIPRFLGWHREVRVVALTPTQSPSLPGEDEVRDLVNQIVDGLGSETKTVDIPEAPDPVETAADTQSVAIAIGADHGGFPLKEKLAFRLREAGFEVRDCGTDSLDAVDYPDFAHAVAREVASGDCTSGIIVDGAGIGSAMVANKVPGVRAALCYDLSSARNSREHNHANVLTLGAGLIGDGLAWQIVQEWLSVDWGGDRHARRVAKIDEVERQYSSLQPEGFLKREI
jgi:ribose 5-phosphate isomerase B